MNKTLSDKQQLFCPVTKVPCPDGEDEAISCIDRFTSPDFNPLENFRDSAILNCGVERIEIRETKAL